jgi:hypothetical protein
MLLVRVHILGSCRHCYPFTNYRRCCYHLVTVHEVFSGDTSAHPRLYHHITLRRTTIRDLVQGTYIFFLRESLKGKGTLVRVIKF